ncbi:hypothetical protein OH77DRAFT_1413055 [Trametes cingulata]|nr:hypothetical protein OH77DRAFT_1413055 [Trametes cingulata]
MMRWSYWLRKEWIWYYVAFTVALVGVILFTVYHKQIVHWLRPAADWMHDLPYGWTIPIGVLFVISFPPLFGHEIVAILCGLVWGLGPGFGIVAAGTFLGEVGNFYAFKYCCAARGEKLEKNKLSYACLARVVREGGFKIALIARLSAIPGHFTTAVFSTCGMGIWTFSIAAILSLPKQFITVYLGVALEQSEDGSSSTRDTIIKDVVLGTTTIITIGAMWYIYHKMNQAKPHVIYERRKARQAKLAMSTAGMGMPYNPVANPAVLESTASVAVFNPTASDAEIPLTASAYGAQGRPSASYQQWDQHGRAVDPYTSSGSVYAPQPQRAPQGGETYAMSARQPQRTSPLPPGAGYPYPYPSSQVPMHRVGAVSPPRDPFADSARVEQSSYSHQQPQQQQYQNPPGVSYQRQAPPRGYGSPPPDAFSRQTPSHRPTQSHAQRIASPPPPALRPPPASAPQTPTQATYFQPPPGAPPLPSQLPSQSQSPPTDPFSDPHPMPNPYERRAGGGHAADATDATFYTAVGGHSRGPSGAKGEEGESPYAATAYESSATIHGDAHGHAHGQGPPPPAYSAAPP